MALASRDQPRLPAGAAAMLTPQRQVGRPGRRAASTSVDRRPPDTWSADDSAAGRA